MWPKYILNTSRPYKSNQVKRQIIYWVHTQKWVQNLVAKHVFLDHLILHLDPPGTSQYGGLLSPSQFEPYAANHGRVSETCLRLVWRPVGIVKKVNINLLHIPSKLRLLCSNMMIQFLTRILEHLKFHFCCWYLNRYMQYWWGNRWGHSTKIHLPPYVQKSTDSSWFSTKKMVQSFCSICVGCKLCDIYQLQYLESLWFYNLWNPSALK